LYDRNIEVLKNLNVIQDIKEPLKTVSARQLLLNHTHLVVEGSCGGLIIFKKNHLGTFDTVLNANMHRPIVRSLLTEHFLFVGYHGGQIQVFNLDQNHPRLFQLLNSSQTPSIDLQYKSGHLFAAFEDGSASIYSLGTTGKFEEVHAWP